MLLVGAPQLWAYATQGWSRWWPAPRESTVEFKLAEWIAQHPPQGRVFASGGLRFRLNSWFDIPQVGGGFETGLRNRVPVDLAYKIRTGHDREETMLNLKALGAEYVVIHGPKSREYYRDFLRPERVSDSLAAVFHIEDDTIYALPSSPLVRPSLTAQWTDTSSLIITGPVSDGEVSLKVSSDPGWHSTQDGHAIAITRAQLGFMALHPSPAAATHIELHYTGTAEQRIMAAISAITWLAAFIKLGTVTSVPNLG